MVRTALEAGLPRPAQAHQRLALLAAATRAGVFPLPEALAVAAVGRRHGQGRQRQAQGRRQGQERFSWASAPWMNALEPLAPPGLTLLRVRFDHGAVANGHDHFARLLDLIITEGRVQVTQLRRAERAVVAKATGGLCYESMHCGGQRRGGVGA